MRPSFPSLLLAFALTVACSSKRPESSGPEKHYTLTGQIVSLDVKNQSANINAAAVPNYMEAMAMDYPVKSKAEFTTLHVGDKIKATLNVGEGGAEYNISDIQKQAAGSK